MSTTPQAVGRSTATKVVAVAVAVVAVLAIAGAVWWFSVRRANAVYFAAAATAESATVVMTVHVEVDDDTLRAMTSDADAPLTAQDVASVGLRVQRLASDQESGLLWLPAGPWSFSVTYQGRNAATVGVTEATGTPVLAALLDPEAIDAALARFSGFPDTTLKSLVEDGSVDPPWQRYWRHLLDGGSVGVDLGPGSHLASLLEEQLRAASGSSEAVEQELLQDVWSRVRDRLSEVVTTTEVGTDDAGTRYSVVVDVRRLVSLVGEALAESCAEQQTLDEDAKASCRDAADELAQWTGEDAPQQLELQVWVKDDRLSRVVFDVAQAIRASGEEDVPADAMLRVVVDLAYDQQPFDFADLVVIPDELLREDLDDLEGTDPSTMFPASATRRP